MTSSTDYAAASVTALYLLAGTDDVRSMRLNLTSGRLRHPGADDAEIARKIIAVRRSLPVATVTVIELVTA